MVRFLAAYEKPDDPAAKLAPQDKGRPWSMSSRTLSSEHVVMFAGMTDVTVDFGRATLTRSPQRSYAACHEF